MLVAHRLALEAVIVFADEFIEFHHERSPNFALRCEKRLMVVDWPETHGRSAIRRL